MTTPFEIPTNPKPERFDISLGGKVRSLSLRWNAADAAWVLDIAEQDGTRVASGLPLVTGADLLAQFEYLGFGGQLVVQTDHNPDVVPTFDSLGSTGHLYFVTE